MGWPFKKRKRRAQVAATPPVVGEQYWKPFSGLTDHPSPIRIRGTDDYRETVADHLSALYQIDAGSLLLEGLCRQDKFSVGIVDHPLTNQCGSMGSTHNMNLVALELYDTLTTSLGHATRAALNKVSNLQGARNREAWLADRINGTPEYQLKGVPANMPRNLGVTEDMVTGWLGGGRSIWSDFDNERDLGFIKNAVIVALYPYAECGAGCSSMVNYTLGDLNPLNNERPPAIGLAHELVHAYYNVRGEQPGFEVENPTTVLFEYLCVGLGPWDNRQGDAISENAIRSGWQSSFPFFDPEDRRNIKDIGRRDQYSAAT